MKESDSFDSLTAFLDEGVWSDGANPEKVAAPGKARLLADRSDFTNISLLLVMIMMVMMMMMRLLCGLRNWSNSTQPVSSVNSAFYYRLTAKILGQHCFSISNFVCDEFVNHIYTGATENVTILCWWTYKAN